MARLLVRHQQRGLLVVVIALSVWLAALPASAVGRSLPTDRNQVGGIIPHQDAGDWQPAGLEGDAAPAPLPADTAGLPRYFGEASTPGAGLTVHVFSGPLRSHVVLTNPDGITSVADYANANFRQTIVFNGTDRVELEIVAQRQLDTTAPYPVDPASLPAEVTEFLVSRPDWIQADDPTLAAKAADLVGGARLQAQAVENIIAFVRGHLTYDYAGPRDASAVYVAGRAYCVGFANLAMALLRASGIPARAQYGIVGAWDGWGSPVEGGRHEWIEVYYPDVGWVASDPQVSANYIDTAHIVGFLAQGGKPGTVVERIAYEGTTSTTDPGYRYSRTAPVTSATGIPLHAATVPAAEGTALLVRPADVMVEVSPDSPRETINIAIDASGPADAGWRIESHAAWLVPLTASGPTPGTAAVEVDGSQVPTGSDVVGTLSVLAEPVGSGATPRNVTVTLRVAQPAPPAAPPQDRPFRLTLPIVLGG